MAVPQSRDRNRDKGFHGQSAGVQWLIKPNQTIRKVFGSDAPDGINRGCRDHWFFSFGLVACLIG
jgi:hypothetical protein